MAALNELAAHTREHFRREEEVMRAGDYPDLAVHKSEHDQLLAELAMLVRDLRERSVAYLDPETFEILKDWLMGHLLDLDRPLAAFLSDPHSPLAGD
jgi:hemerythrin